MSGLTEHGVNGKKRSFRPKWNPNKVYCRNCPGQCGHINHQIKDTAPRCIVHSRCPRWAPSKTNRWKYRCSQEKV